MSNDQTFIEHPQPQGGDDYSDLPPMPPPPPPPGRSGGGSRKWLALGLVGGLVVLVVCLAGGYVIWQLLQDGSLPFGERESGAPDGAAMTQTALVAEVQEVLLATDTPEPAPTDPPTDPPPTGTAVPTEVPTDTLVPTVSVPIFTAGQALFCRLGPSSVYREVRTMNAGDVQPVIGQSISPVDGTSVWWQVEIEGRQCYVSADLGSVEGDVSNLPVIPAPPTPTATPTATPTYTPTPTATP